MWDFINITPNWALPGICLKVEDFCPASFLFLFHTMDVGLVTAGVEVLPCWIWSTLGLGPRKCLDSCSSPMDGRSGRGSGVIVLHLVQSTFCTGLQIRTKEEQITKMNNLHVGFLFARVQDSKEQLFSWKSCSSDVANNFSAT